MPLPAIDAAGFAPPPPTGFAEPAVRRPGSTDSAGLTKVARGGVLNLAGAMISAGASVGLTVVVTRSFDPSVVGTFFVAMSLFLIVEAVANLGAYNGAIYFIARLRALRAERRIPAIVRASVVPVVGASVIGAAAMAVFAGPLAHLLTDGHFGDGVSAAGVAGTVRILALALPFAALADTLLGATRGYQAMRPTVAVDRIGRSALQLLGVFGAAALTSSALLAPLWALPYLPAAGAAALWLRRVTRRSQLADRELRALPSGGGPATGLIPLRLAAESADLAAMGNRHGKPNAKGFWRFTTPRSIASIAQIVIQRLDIVLVGIMRGPVDAAIYTAATRFLVAGQLGNAAISMAAQPQLTRLFAVRDTDGANTVYQVTTAWLILLTWPLYLLAIVFGPAVLGIFGHGYHAGAAVMVILALSMLVATACGQVDMVLITTGRSGWSLANGLLAMAVNIGVDLALIPRMGITGAAIGWAAAIILSNLVPLVQVALSVHVHPFGQGTGYACALTVVSFAAVPFAVRTMAGTGPGASVAAIALGCIVMLIGSWRLNGTLHLSVLPTPRRRTVPALPSPRRY